MAYSTSAKTVREIEHLLDPLKDPESPGALFVAKDTPGGVPPARFLAYKLREAMWIARECHPELFPELARASTKFRFVLRSRTTVEAVPRSGQQQYESAPVVRTAEREQATVSGDSRTVAGRANTNAIVAGWIEGPSRVYYPEARLSDDDLLRLWRWCEARGMSFFENEGAVTILTKPSPDEKELAWNPTDIGEVV